MHPSHRKFDASGRKVEFVAVRYFRRDKGGKTGLRWLGYDVRQ